MGPLVLATLPQRLPPRAGQSIDVYGYALDPVDGARLVHSDGSYTSSTYSTRADTWLRFDFDLRSARPGPRALELWAGGELIVREDDVVFVDTVDPRRFRPAWIEEGVAREVDLVLGDTALDFDLALVDPEGTQRAFTSVTETAGDTLRVGLPPLVAGVYGLRLRYAQGDEVAVEAMLRVGPPPARRVPEEYETLGEAITAAQAGDEILVGPGSYVESVVIDRPVRIRGTSGSPNDTRISLNGSPGARGIHVLESAGRIVEIANLEVWSARIPGGPGAGIYAEVPVLIADAGVYLCRSEGEGAIGGGIWAAPGSEIVGTQCGSNLVRSEWHSTPDPFVEPSGGTAGGIYAVGCRVERCSLSSNYAQSCGEAVVDGLFLGNIIESDGGGYGLGAINSFALRGKVQGNRFEHGCGAAAPYAVFFGPSEVDHNTFTDWWWDLCSALSLLQIQGAVDFHHNSLAGVGLQVCRQHQAADPDVGAIRVWANLIESADTAWPSIQYCEARLGPGPVNNVPATQIEFAYNVGHPITMFNAEGADDCGDCVIPRESVGYCEVKWHDGYYSYGSFDLRPQSTSPALPSNFPYFPDTLGAVTEICSEVSPIFLEFARVERSDAGVLLEWSLSSDIEVTGVGIERRELPAGSGFERIGPDWLADCGRCTFVDETADPGTGYEYVALVLHPDGDVERVPLGQVSGDLLPSPPLLGPPRPNPTTDRFSVPFRSPGNVPIVIELVDAAGRRVETLWDGVVEDGVQEVGCPPGAAPLPSGVYWLRLRSAHGVKLSQRLVIIR